MIFKAGKRKKEKKRKKKKISPRQEHCSEFKANVDYRVEPRLKYFSKRKKEQNCWAGEMAGRLRALTALVELLGPVHMVTNSL